MTRINLLSKIKFLFLATIANLAIILVKAQEKTSDIKVDDNHTTGRLIGSDWMTSPLVWVISALFFIIIIALLARSGNRK